ncbi:flagellar biosynthesis protein FlgK [Phenylobacterium sp. Root77]|uniref:flagellar hook-associated protein FlgK n=1 Tax=unclassified Phenylobacterium TaxID=2640670 RepID=UPI0006F7D916|nr:MULTISPECIES: flagellar hook-associated protein FlgK [unclassified Phenylobacterium]KQW68230.1 flagellar biosynthesis protein FlgK [Phenylobacterium sp. Root1277]KQW91971.1 flagellar biosynthesis protein FlgK [Phenylobacterium sp. Root1290]KRC40203.1 flagellar biosynthesis protein FlgK [Phenylobacterium sp. Root77]
MSLTAMLKTASSGLNAAQMNLRVTSDNIANVNTPGYVRKQVDQAPLVVGGQGMGVDIQGVRRVTDQYLQLASLTASSDASRWDAFSQYLDNAQSLFGNPGKETFYFSRLDQIFNAFAAAADDPSSSLLRSQGISKVEDFLTETGRINAQINELGETVDARISSNVNRINDLLRQINQMNADISRAKLTSGDASGSENIQSQLVDELSTLMNVQVAQRTNGGVTVRSAEGLLLAGDGKAATLSYNRTDATKGYIAVEPEGGVGFPQPIQISGGEIRGLMDLRDTTLPGMSDQLGEFISRTVEQINAAHNKTTASPPPKALNGRDTGLDLPTAVGGFTGRTTVAILDKDGIVQSRVDIDFDAGTMVPGGAFTPASFLTSLNTAMGGAATASFTDGALSLTGTGDNRIAIEEGTSAKAGRGFSHFFGLNDLVRSGGMMSYETGLRGTDPHGFTPGQTISFRLAQADGKPIRDMTFTVPPAPANSMNDLLTALNDPVTGVGTNGQFSLDSKGALTFSGSAPQNATLSITQDQTQRGASGPSMSQLFGLGVIERNGRASRYDIDAAISQDPMKLGLATLDLSVAAGKPAVTAGDGRGARLLAAAGDVTTTFSPAGTLGTVSMTLSRYAAEFGGSIGRQAEAAENRKSAAESVSNEAQARREAVEGVNVDEELVRLTTYQQAFNASARMIQAAKELFDVLTNMV